jgi:hypothetical protein
MSSSASTAYRPHTEQDNDQSEPLFTRDIDEDPMTGSDASHEALYAVLNLPKDCSNDDIAKAYKRLAGKLQGRYAPYCALMS